MSGYIIWIVIGTVLVIMAIIGYVAEHSGNNEKSKKENTNIPEVNVANIEAKEGAATWSKDAKPKDEKQEIMHEVPSIDDWTKLPVTEDKLPEVKLEEPKEEVSSEPMVESAPMFADVDTNNSVISEPTTEVLSVASPVTTPTQVPTPSPVPASTESVEPVVLPSSNSDVSPTLIVSEVDAVPTAEPTLVLDSPVNEGTTEASLDSSQASVSSSEPVEPAVLPASNIEISPTLTASEVDVVPTTEPTLVLDSPVNESITEASLDSSQASVSSSEPVVSEISSEPVTAPVSEQITEPVNVENIWS